MKEIIELMDELKDRYQQYECMHMDRGSRTVLELYIKGLEARLIKKLQER